MSNTMRMSGLVSGMDTDATVKSLMKTERVPLDKLKQKKQIEEWKRDDYREMNALLLDLKNTALNMKLQGTFQKKLVTSDNENVATVKQMGQPSLSSYTIDVISAPAEAQPALVKFQADASVADDSAELNQAFSFKLNDVKIDVAATDSISNIISKVNSVSAKTGVSASYMEGGKSITFTTLSGGSNAKVSISEVSGSNKLNITQGIVNGTQNTFPAGTAKQSSNVVPGEVKINGLSYPVNSSTFTFDGVEISLKKSATYPVSAKISLKTNEDEVFKSIKGFVDKYNEVIDKINTKLQESHNKDYQPLTDDQKESLSDTQIEKWETIAKTGLLQRDSMLSGALGDLRLALANNVAGASDPKADNLSEIGITTGTYTENGKLYINEDDLREAIREKGDKVMEIFTKKGVSADPDTNYKESGIAVRLYDQLNKAMSKITDKAGSAASLTDKSVMGKNIDKYSKDIKQWESRLSDIEDRYYKRFSAMETALDKINQQGNYLLQQFGGGSSSK